MPACSSPPGRMPMTAWTARAWRPCAGTTAPSWPTSSLPPCDACSSTGEWDLPPAPEARPQPLSLRPRSPGPQPPPPLGTQVSGPARPQWWNGGKSVGLDSCGPRPRLCHLAPCGLAASLPALGFSPRAHPGPPASGVVEVPAQALAATGDTPHPGPAETPRAPWPTRRTSSPTCCVTALTSPSWSSPRS